MLASPLVSPSRSRLTLFSRRRETTLAILLLGLLLIVGFFNPAFVSPDQLRGMLMQCAPAAIVACGLTLVMVAGEIDISVGSMMALLAAVMGHCASAEHLAWPAWAAAGMTLALGTLIGLINGLLVTTGRVPSIIVTLGMLSALRGVTELLMAGEWIKALPDDLRSLGTGALLGIPISVWTALLAVIGTTLLARQSPLGRCIYAVGHDPAAARRAGVSPTRVKLLVFMLTGFLVASATLVGTTRLSVIESGIGVGFELLVVTAVVVGGTSVSGGRGSITGSTLAILLLTFIPSALIFMKLGQQSVYWERAMQGAFILVAVLFDAEARRRGASRP